VLLATPFAWLSEAIGTRDALAGLRLMTPLLAAVGVALAARVVRGRGAAATVATGAVMALFPAELYALRSVLLEPVLNLFCLLGVAAVHGGGTWTAERRRFVLAGALFGIALTIKATALLPLAVMAAICAVAPRARLVPFLAGAAAGFLVPS